MMRFLLPLILLLLGLGGGIGAGMFLVKPEESEEVAEHSQTDACAPSHVVAVSDSDAPPVRIDAAALEDREYVKLNNQFVVPVVTETRVAALVVMSVTIETQIGNSEIVYSREPKLRDLFLRTLFDQASLGRFSGEFANAANLKPLRDELTVIARRVLGPEVSDVLITDISRQDA